MSIRDAKILSALPYFRAVAEHLNFSRAALELGMSQPPLSRRILLLETEIGARLFERNRHEVRLTPAGAALKRNAELLKTHLDATMREVQQLSADGPKQLRVGFVSSAVYGILPQAAMMFRQSYQDVEVDLKEHLTFDQLDLIRGNRLDVGVVRTPVDADDMTVIPLQLDRMFIVLPRAHRLTLMTELAPDDIKAENFVMYSRSSIPTLHDIVLAWCMDCGFYPQIVQEARQIATILSLVAAGTGLAFVPESVCRFLPDAVEARPLCNRPLTTSLAAIFLTHRHSTLVSSFVNMLAATARSSQRGA